jgi:hypothetical protein
MNCANCGCYIPYDPRNDGYDLCDDCDDDHLCDDCDDDEEVNE